MAIQHRQSTCGAVIGATLNTECATPTSSAKGGGEGNVAWHVAAWHVAVCVAMFLVNA